MKSSLSSSVLANVLQTLAGAALLFALYRYINASLGVEQLGVWSVVLASVSASRVADFGLLAGVTRFVARDLAHGEIARASQVVDTAALTVGALMGTILPLLYPLLARLLPLLFDSEHLPQAQKILPYAVGSMWLAVVAAVFQGGLDGCQRMDLRGGLVVAGQVVLLAAALWLVPNRGLIGLASAQLVQGIFLLVAGRLLLRRVLHRNLPWFPRCWNRLVLRDMFSYGVNVQVASAFMLLFDPLTKALMAHFGGVASAGYFEMAGQVVLKARTVIVAANQAIVPYVASMAENAPAKVADLYRRNMNVLAFVALPTFALLFAWSGGISWLLTKAYSANFVFLMGMLGIAWLCNIFASPAYFANMGTGEVGWNTLSHLIMGILNAGLGWLFGSHYGANGVALAYAVALIAGSGFLVGIYQHRSRLGLRCGFARNQVGLLAACLVVTIAGWLEPLGSQRGKPSVHALGLLLPPLILGLALWLHPMRRQFLGALMSRAGRA